MEPARASSGRDGCAHAQFMSRFARRRGAEMSWGLARIMMLGRVPVFALALCVLAGCSTSKSPNSDAGVDASVEPPDGSVAPDMGMTMDGTLCATFYGSPC